MGHEGRIKVLFNAPRLELQAKARWIKDKLVGATPDNAEVSLDIEGGWREKPIGHVVLSHVFEWDASRVCGGVLVDACEYPDAARWFIAQASDHVHLWVEPESPAVARMGLGEYNHGSSVSESASLYTDERARFAG